MNDVRLIQGNALTVLKNLEDASVQCCITSPPYWGLRDYGMTDQIGLEPTVFGYVAQLVAVFDEVRRILRTDGTLWLNLGDSYWRNPKRGNQEKGNHAGLHRGRTAAEAMQHKTSLLEEKNLLGVPWKVAFALQDAGWILRSDIIWAKPNPMPESVMDRPTRSHEYIFLLTKAKSYYYNADAIKEPVAASTIGRGPVDFGGKKGREYTPQRGDPNFRNGNEQWGRTFDYRKSCMNGRNKRSVWTVSTKPYADAHFAVFPEALIVPCIKAGSRHNDFVLDPFCGSGTTGVVALKFGRQFIGIDLNPQYLTLAENRLKPFRNQQLQSFNHPTEVNNGIPPPAKAAGILPTTT